MSDFVGADASGLDTLATQFGQASEALETMRTNIGGRLHSVHWHGHDADQVRHQWDHYDSPAIGTTAAALRTAVGQLQAQARQQRAASGSDGAVGGVERVLQAGQIPVHHASAPEHRGGGLFGRFTSGLHALEHDADRAVHVVGDAAKADWHEAAKIQHEIVTSPEFLEVVSVSHEAATLLADVAPIVGLFPGGQAVAAAMMVTAVAAQGIYLAGSALEMANHVDGVTASTLMGGTLDLAVDAAGAGDLKLGADAAKATQDATVMADGVKTADEAVAGSTVLEQKSLALQKILPKLSPDDATRAVRSLKLVPTLVGGGRMGDDLQNHDYRDAFKDGLSGLSGGAPDGNVGDVITVGSSEVSTYDDVQDIRAGKYVDGGP